MQKIFNIIAVVGVVIVLFWQNNKINRLHEAIRASGEMHRIHSQVNQEQYEILEELNNIWYQLVQIMDYSGITIK